MIGDSIVTAGTFDGVHLGHLRVIDTLKREAEARRLTPVVVTFPTHPLGVIAPERAPGMLTSAQEKVRLLREQGVEVRLFDFDEQLRRTTARDWLRKLRDELGAKAVVIGYDNTFGSDGRKMTPSDYLNAGLEAGLEMIQAEVLPGISSSIIRKTLGTGDVEGAGRMLGRPYALEGEVVHGRHLGSKLGFPTANVRPTSDRLVPLPGVYAGEAMGKPAVINVGYRPSVQSHGDLSIECHIPGYEGDLYGRELRVSFKRRLRDERRFPTLEDLRVAVNADIRSLGSGGVS